MVACKFILQLGVYKVHLPIIIASEGQAVYREDCPGNFREGFGDAGGGGGGGLVD